MDHPIKILKWMIGGIPILGHLHIITLLKNMHLLQYPYFDMICDAIYHREKISISEQIRLLF